MNPQKLLLVCIKFVKDGNSSYDLAKDNKIIIKVMSFILTTYL